MRLKQLRDFCLFESEMFLLVFIIGKILNSTNSIEQKYIKNFNIKVLLQFFCKKNVNENDKENTNN
ncbi:hypothetical protein SAMN05216297_108198 [Flavobacterium phragmitis]|uniref:Uncharacterized protein n=1 Tax=Flavobacterium phragmitis TaxID=739143 RepID=A0A1I1T2T4_9FLAO|nr:hypothetical protein SAMN05216297_108198 [Flavobacterium phragmitis]